MSYDDLGVFIQRVSRSLSCVQLCKNLMDGSLLGSSVHGLLQVRILEWVAIPFCRGSSQPRDQTWSPALQADSLPAAATREATNGISHRAAAAAAKLLQSCPTLCDPIDGSPPDSPIPGILQATTQHLEILRGTEIVKVTVAQ